MNQIKKHLEIQKREIEVIMKKGIKELDCLPEGSLRVITNKSTTQYYLRTNSQQPNGKYIKKKNMDLVRKLAQKEYIERLLKEAKEQKDCIEKFLKTYDNYKVIDVYNNISEKKKEHITPYILPMDEYVEMWKKEKYQSKGFNTVEDEFDGIYTENGERVRSKSEKILADKFRAMNIPYKYERELYLKGLGKIYPDFTLLNIWTREEYYWEHMGMMDNELYSEKAIKKIEYYEKNGIFPGKNLIISYETSTHSINMKIVESLINEFLINRY